MLRSHFVIGAAGVVLVNRIVLWTSTTPAAATASALPSSALEELEIGLNVFNELDDADFSRYSSPAGEKYRSSSSETGRPAATPLRRGVFAKSASVSLCPQLRATPHSCTWTRCHSAPHQLRA